MTYTTSNHSAFELIRTENIASLAVEFQEYKHRKTGARHYHLAADEGNNAFCVALMTVPEDSTGVAHVLEHTSLCGSKHFPVRDPFFMMLRRSLNTFMNAMTANDWTAYPFASQNEKDFDNLLQVYLDAVFFPNLDPLDFAQEGWRVEFETPDDPGSDLVYKGVVFNEMKGAMSAPVRAVGETLDAWLFPTTTYHYNSGGDPEEIPNLTHEYLKAFHARHYHPSNAIFMTFGNFDVNRHHQRFEDLVLSQFEASSDLPRIDDEQRYTSPVYVTDSYAFETDEDTRRQTHIVSGWLLGKSTSARDSLDLYLLNGVLLDNSSSPLMHALETTDLGTAPSPLSGIDDSNHESTFCCGLEGCEPDSAEAVERLILDVLEDVANKGVPQEKLESVLHQVELHQRSLDSGGYPYGLRLAMRCLTPALHGADPVGFLAMDKLLEQARRDIADPAFIKNLVRKLLLDNPHRVQVVSSPDKQLGANRAAREKQRLAEIKAALSQQDIEQLIETTRALQERQAIEDDPEILPKVTVSDVPIERPIPAGEQSRIIDTPITSFQAGTNGLVYQQTIIDLPEFSSEQMDLLSLFCDCLTDVGCGKLDYAENQARQAALTGGIGAHLSVRGHIDDVQKTRGAFVLRGKALARNQQALADILADTLQNARFDELPRLRELVAQYRANEESSITDRGHSLAMMAARAGLSPGAALDHRWDGLLGLRNLRALDDALADDDALARFASTLQEIQQKLLNSPRQFLIANEASQKAAATDVIESAWRDLPVANQPAGATGAELDLPAADAPVNESWAVNTQVNFCARAYPTVASGHEDAAALTVLGPFLRNGFLHTAIREQGGAYGAGAGYHGDSGAFQFFSYRDPRLEETLQDFSASLIWLEDNDHEQRQLEEAILGVIGSIDNPGSPAGEAITTFMASYHGRDAEYRQMARRRILDVTIDDLKRVSKTWLRAGKARTAIVSNQANLDTANLPGSTRQSL